MISKDPRVGNKFKRSLMIKVPVPLPQGLGGEGVVSAIEKPGGWNPPPQRAGWFVLA